jgi:hypothetical protein
LLNESAQLSDRIKSARIQLGIFDPHPELLFDEYSQVDQME